MYNGIELDRMVAEQMGVKYDADGSIFYSIALQDAQKVISFLIDKCDAYVELSCMKIFSTDEKQTITCKIFSFNQYGAYEASADTISLAVCRAFMSIPKDILRRRLNEVQSR